MSSLHTPPKPVRRGSSFSAAGPQTSRPQFRSKFSVSYEALLAGEHPWIATPSSSGSSSLLNTPALSSASTLPNGYFAPPGKKPSAPRVRFFADLLCLKVEPQTLEALVKGVSPRQLTDDDESSKGARIRENVGSLWRECLRVWTDVPSGAEQDALFASSSVNISTEVRRVNAIGTLVELSRNILAKNFTHSSSSLDLIWIFAGGIDEADDVFEELVSAIDAGLRGELDNVLHHRRTVRPTRMPSSLDADASLAQQRQRNAATEPTSDLPTLRELLQHRLGAVHLAIVWISHVSATNLSAYFIRRDLFVGVCALLNGVQSILRTAHQAARSELAEQDEELLRVIVRDTMLLVGLLGGLGQGATSGTGIGVGRSSIDATSSPYFRRMCDWVDSGSMHLLRESLSVDLEQAWRAFESRESGSSPDNAQPGVTSGIAASLGAVTEGLMKMTTSSATMTDANSALPPAQVASLLSIYLMCRANQVFVEIAMQERAPKSTGSAAADTGTAATDLSDDKATFATSLLSLTSYLVSHGSLNERARSYSRLALLVPLTLLTNSAGISALALTNRPNDAAAIQLCMQRSGPLPIRYPDPVESGMSLTSLFSHLTSYGGGAQGGQARTRLLPYVLDVCVQYMRHNLRKRLDTAGFLICMQVLLLSIQTCADRRIELDYKEWPDVWGTITSTISFLVGRHAELRGVEVGKLGQALLSLLSLALLESDRFLPTRHDTDVLIYQLVRSNDVLRRLACIVALGRDPADKGGVSASGGTDTEKVSQRAIVAALPMWRLLDLTLVSFDEKLAEWSDKRSIRSAFALPFSVSALTGGYLGRSANQEGAAAAAGGSDKKCSSGTGTPTGGALTQTQRMPDVQTVLSLISSLDMELIVQRFYSEGEGGGGSSSAGLATPLSFGGAASPSIPGRSSSRMNSIVSRKGVFIDEEWLERAESQCLAEAFRFASDDMRKLVAASAA